MLGFLLGMGGIEGTGSVIFEHSNVLHTTLSGIEGSRDESDTDFV